MYLSVVVFVDGEDIITFVIYEEMVCRSHLCAGLSHFFYFHIWPSDSTIIQCAFRFLQFSAVCMLILSVELALSMILISKCILLSLTVSLYICSVAVL